MEHDKTHSTSLTKEQLESNDLHHDFALTNRNVFIDRAHSYDTWAIRI